MDNIKLKEKYGRNKKPRQLFNAAIRAEIPCGAQLLGVDEMLHHIANRKGLSKDCQAFLQDAMTRTEAIRNEHVAEIKRRYDIPSNGKYLLESWLAELDEWKASENIPDDTLDCVNSVWINLIEMVEELKPE
jgi:hypothetical protein